MVFQSQDEYNANSETVNFICRSTPALDLTSLQDDSQFVDLDDSESGDVVFTSQTDAKDNHSIGSETVSLTCRSTPTPHLTSP